MAAERASLLGPVLFFALLAILGPCVVAKSAKSKSAKPGASTTGGSRRCPHAGFYSKKVVPLCEKHFPDDASKHVWLVQFYHSYVSKNLEAKPIFEETAAAPALLDGARVGAVDCQHNNDFCVKHGIRKAPTTRAIRGANARDFEGEYTVENLRAFVKDSVTRFEDMESAMKCDVKGLFADPMKDVAVPLCTSSFPPALEPVPWVVTFYEAGDRHKDKSIRSTLNRLAEKYGGIPPKKVNAVKKKTLKLRFGAIECGNAASECGKLGVSKLPTIRFYRTGAEPVDFDSFFDSDELKQWADARLKEMPKLEKVEALKADMPESETPAQEEAPDDAHPEL